MQSKLTLRLDDKLIREAKSYASEAEISLSKLVADYFRLLMSGKSATRKTGSPVTQSLRGVLKGEPTTTLAAELGVSYQTVLNLRHDLQANARRMQPDTPLPDNVTESDEMFQNAGEKRGRTLRRGGSAAWSGE